MRFARFCRPVQLLFESVLLVFPLRVASPAAVFAYPDRSVVAFQSKWFAIADTALLDADLSGTATASGLRTVERDRIHSAAETPIRRSGDIGCAVGRVADVGGRQNRTPDVPRPAAQKTMPLTPAAAC